MIIDFNRYNGGGSGSGSTDLTNYWNSAVTEQHIESAASITYASAVSYTDAALSGFTPAGNSNILAAITTDEEYEAISGSVKSGDLIEVWDVDINGDEETEYGLFQASNVHEGVIDWIQRDNSDSVSWSVKDYPWMDDNGVLPIELGPDTFLISAVEDAFNGIGFDGDGNPVITHIVPQYEEGEITGMTREDTPIGGGGSTEEIELPVAAAINDVKDTFNIKLNQKYYTKEEVLGLLKEKMTAGQVTNEMVAYVTPIVNLIYATIADKELTISAALNDLNTRLNNN